MASQQSGTTGTSHAITDLYDERTNSFLVQYPPLFIIGMALAGLVSLAITGFFGYLYNNGSQPNGLDWFFQQPWLLFLWLDALTITLIWSILRDRSLRRQRIQIITAAVIAAAIVMLVIFFHDVWDAIVQAISHLTAFIPSFRVGSGITLAIINYGILLVYWSDSIRRWVLRARGKPVIPQVDLHFHDEKDNASSTRLALIPSLQELIAGDLIAGAALTSALWGIFMPDTLKAIAGALGVAPSDGSAPQCAGNCSHVDYIQMIIFVTIGLFVLALTAMINALGAINAVDRNVVNITSTEIAQPVDNSGMTGTDKETKAVVQTLLETLLGALRGQGAGKGLLGILRTIFVRLTLAFRTIAWPIFILISMALLAEVARYIQYYMHGSSCLHTNLLASACDTYSLTHNDPATLVFDAGVVLVCGLFSAAATILAVTLLIYQTRIAENAFRFLGLTAFIVLLTEWIFALALSGFNALVSRYVLDMTQRAPFYQPDGATLVSLATLLLYVLLFLIRRPARSFLPGLVPKRSSPSTSSSTTE
jgi:hypothetical protein